MDKEFYDKYSKDLECSYCPHLEHCINGKEPLKINCAIHYFKDKIAELETKLAESKKLNKRLEQIVDKLRDKEFAGKHLVEAVNAVYEPLYQNKYDETEQLKQQLAEKEKELAKWRNKKVKHLVNGLLVDRNLAIQTVEEIREDFRQNSFCNDYHEYIVDMEIFEYFNNKIKSLKGESE